MLKLKHNYLVDIKAAKNKIISHLQCPIFPDGLWTNVLVGHFIDLDKVYSRYYALHSNYRHTQSIGDIDISLNLGGSNAKPSRSVQTHGEWVIAFAGLKGAVLFAYPHRASELGEYEQFIIGQFAAFSDVTQHFRILNLDRAICLCISQSNKLLLISFAQFNGLTTHHLLSIVGASGSKSIPVKQTKLASDGDIPIRRHWNSGKCSSDSC
jgi:hypothetical protein